MKNLLLCLLSLSLINFGFAQDTTSFRMLGMSSGAGDLQFHNSDSSGLITLNHGYTSGHAVFVNPADEMVYMIVDADGAGDRNLYQVNPFDATSTLVHDFTQDYIHTADLGEDGILYCIVGNGAANAAELVTLDLNTMTESATGFVTAANSSRAMEYNPVDSALYIYGGFSGLVWVVDLATMTETTQATTGLTTELHGAFYDEEESVMHLSAYSQSLFITDNSLLNATEYATSTGTRMDLSLIKLIRGEAAAGYCPGDSAMLSLIYTNTDFKWFRDGNELTQTNDTIYVSSPGVYRAAVAIGTTGNYMWSREIIVSPFMVPNVIISQATNDTEICEGETIVLEGASGGTLQWYLNGSPIPGETGSTYAATAPGVYNQMKTNMSGCSDSSAVSYVITGCLGINELNANVTIYPVPADNYLNLDATSTIRSVFITELTGRRVMAINNVNGNNVIVNTTSLSKGTYIVQVHTEAGVIQKTILK